MEAAPHGLFVRQSKQISVLAQVLQQAVKDLPGAKDFCASAHEIEREAHALSLSKGLEVPSVSAYAVDPMSPKPRNTSVQRPQSAGPRGGPSNSGGALGTVRVGDFREDLDALCAQMRRARADLDALGCSARRHDESAQQSITEIRRLRSDLQDMQEALVTHDNDIQDLTVASRAASKKIDVETEAWRAATVRDATEVRQLLKGMSEDVDADFQKLQQALDSGLSEDRRLINKFTTELRTEISGVTGATGQDTKDWIKFHTAEQERHLAAVQTRVSEQITDGLSRYAEGLKVEMRELRGRMEAELTSCRQEQSLLGQRFSSSLEDVGRTSRRAIEEVADVQKAVSQFGTELCVVQRGIEDVRHAATQATESLVAQFEMRLRENQTAANDSGIHQIEQQAETMANIITRQVVEVRAEFDMTIASVSARLDECNAQQLASTQSFSSAQEELERQLRDCVVVVGQHAEAVNDRVATKLEEVQARSASAIEELKSSIISQQDKFEKVLSEARLASKGLGDVAAEKLRVDIEHRLTELRITLSDVKQELNSSQRGLEHELASAHKAHNEKATQLKEDLNDVRRRFDGLEVDDATRARETAERAESAAKQSTVEVASTLKSMREQMRTDHESLAVEVRGLLAHSEQRLRLGIDALQNRVDEGQAASRRTQSDANGELQRLQGGLHEAERVLATLSSSIHNVAEGGSRASNQVTSQEMKAHDEELRQLRHAGDILATGILRIAQIIGVLPDHGPVDDARNGGGLNLTELLRWEREGNTLVKRMESVWQPRSLAQGGSMIEVLSRKAEQTTLRLVQSAIRDLDVRISHMRPGGAADALGPPPWMNKLGPVGNFVGEKGDVPTGDLERKNLEAETHQHRPASLIPRPPSAPPPFRNGGEEGTFARRIGAPSPSVESCANMPPPAWA